MRPLAVRIAAMHKIRWRRVVYRDLYWQTGYERVNLGIVKDVGNADPTLSL